MVAFHAQFAPFEYLSAVVASELRAGVRSPAEGARIDRHLLAPFERRGRVFAPSYDAWKAAGAAHALLRSSPPSRGFHNDLLLAVSCREHGITLVTRNAGDFERIQRVVRFEFIADWPA